MKWCLKLSTSSNYWLDIAAEDIIAQYPTGDIVVSSGISPSASYHVGHFREIMTADAIAWAVRKRGRTAIHIHVVDDFDPLRKWYDFLPPAPQDYSGWPVAMVPDPVGDCHTSYADHFYDEFKQSLEPMGIGGEGFVIMRSYEELYKTGKMNPYMQTVLEQTAAIKNVFETQFKRELDADWTPVSILNAEGRFERAKLSAWDHQQHTLGGVSYLDGGGKLDWRLDWPARWALLKVNVEPFGAQEHGAAGGSYETGSVFARQIFNVEPPYAKVQYAHIHRPGEAIKMSSSKGNVVTPSEALEVMPAEILRYFLVRSKPDRKLYFDTGLGLYNLIAEFKDASVDPQHEFRDAFNFAVSGTQTAIISTVPFKHLVQVYQAARGDAQQTLVIIQRTGFDEHVSSQESVILAELHFVKNWLEKYAPEDVKFTVQESFLKTELTDTQQGFLKDLARAVSEAPIELDGNAMHTLIYAAKDTAGLQPKEAFQALYRVIIGKDYGPKAGWFLASLNRDWLVKRLSMQI